MRRTERSSKGDQGRHPYGDDPNRPALSPINARSAANSTSIRSKSFRLPATSTSTQSGSNVLDAMKGYSAVSDNPFFGEDSEFDLMHIKITVYGLSGLLIERHSDKGEQPTSGRKGSTSSSGMSSGSTITSCEDTYNRRTEAPVYAVVTHKRNVSNSATSIASHLPSMPLGHSLSSFGKIYRHAASWPANSAPLIIDEDDECSLMDQSSFIMERVMMREPYDRQRFNGSNAAISCFVHETVDLEINLKRGNEMIPLGIASLVVSGDEEGALKMNLPAKEVAFKRKKQRAARTKDGKKKKNEDGKKHRRIFSKTADKPCFPSDKTKEYSLDENATLKIALQVIPHSSFIETGVAKERHADKERRLRENKDRARAQDENSIHNYQARLQDRLKGMHLNAPQSQDDTADKRDSASVVTEFLCSPIMCLVGDKKEASGSRNRKSPGDDFSMDKSSMNSYMRERGVYDESSVLSSVSESESESEDEDDPIHVLDTDIMVRKRTYA